MNYQHSIKTSADFLLTSGRRRTKIEKELRTKARLKQTRGR